MLEAAKKKQQNSVVYIQNIWVLAEKQDRKKKKIIDSIMYPLCRIYIKTNVRSQLYSISIAPIIYICFSFLWDFFLWILLFFLCVFSFNFYTNFHFSLVPKMKTDATKRMYVCIFLNGQLRKTTFKCFYLASTQFGRQLWVSSLLGLYNYRPVYWHFS